MILLAFLLIFFSHHLVSQKQISLARTSQSSYPAYLGEALLMQNYIIQKGHSPPKYEHTAEIMVSKDAFFLCELNVCICEMGRIVHTHAKKKKKEVHPLITAVCFSDCWIKQVVDSWWFYTVLMQMLFFAEAISSSLQYTWSGSRLLEYIFLATVGIISCPGESSFPNTPSILSAALWASKTCPSVSDKHSRARASLKQSFPELCVTLYHVMIKTSSFSLAVCYNSWPSPNKEFYVVFSNNCDSE